MAGIAELVDDSGIRIADELYRALQETITEVLEQEREHLQAAGGPVFVEAYEARLRQVISARMMLLCSDGMKGWSEVLKNLREERNG